MKIISIKNTGFQNININFRSMIDEEPPTSPLKKPSITLELPNSKDNREYVTDNFLIVKKMGYYVIDSSNRIFTITGHRKIAEIIGLIINHPDYNHAENADVLKTLIAAKEYINKVKPPKILPSKSKEYAKYDVMDEAVTREEGTGVPIHSVVKVKKKNSDTIDILKLDPFGRSITEIEAFNGICYQILLNNQTPKCRSVHDEKGHRIGVLSRYVNNFQSLQDYTCIQKSKFGFFYMPSQENLVQSGIGRILAAAYCEEENDLHCGNIGYDPVNFKTYKIDHDRATWPITSKYRGKLADKKQGSGRSEGITPNDAFPITQHDISNFPCLLDTKPSYFPDQAIELKLDGVKNNRTFIKDAFTIFLKKSLLDELVYTNIAASTIGNLKLREKLVANKTERSNNLKSELLKNPKFYQFILKNQHIKSGILFELEQYNNEYKSDNPLRIDLKQVEKNYDDLYAVILENKDKIQHEELNDLYSYSSDEDEIEVEDECKITINRRRT